MKDIITIIAALIPVAQSAYRKLKEIKDGSQKKKILQATRDNALDKLNELIVGDVYDNEGR